MNKKSCKIWILSGFWCWTLTVFSIGNAQISPDSTLGSNSTVYSERKINGLPDLIEGGLIQGENLFHSFLKFNVGDNGVYFSSPSTIKNIITRVTLISPSNTSNILGTLGVLGDANLFIINPNGILFGPNSRLDLKGSFLASTANKFVFGDGLEFSASNPQLPSPLMINVPTGLSFRETPGNIVNNSSPTIDSFGNFVGGLQVPSGKIINLVGGNILFEGGNIISSGTSIELGSVGNDSLVHLTPFDSGWKLGYKNANNYLDITLSQSSNLITSGQDGGNIKLQGKQIKVTDGSGIFSTDGENPSGNISISASESVSIDNGSNLLSGALSGTDPSGNIDIRTKRFSVNNQSFIDSSSDSSGKSGDITVLGFNSPASKLININNSQLTTQSLGGGDGGNVTLDTEQLLVYEEGQITSSTFSDGKPGNIIINVSDLIQINSKGSGIFAGNFTKDNVVGSAGNLKITTNRLILQDGAEISVKSVGGGSAGVLDVNARSVLLENGSSLIAESTGGSGDIKINSDDIILRTKSGITASATGKARGGNITINTGVLTALENSDITADSEEDFGGRLSISARGIFGAKYRLQPSSESDITASSKLGPDFSGTVVLNVTGVDPNQGLVELPATVIDPSTLVAQNPCKRASSSEFTRSGRGGLPPSLSQDLNGESTQVGLVEPANVSTQKPEPKSNSKTVTSLPQNSSQIVPAQGWIYNDKGEVVLVAYNSAVTASQRLQSVPTGCPVQ